MKNVRKSIFAALVLSTGILFSCTKISPGSGELYTPTAADVTANATLAELQEGRTLYINNCGKCHSLASPDAYTPTTWNGILASMAPKTSLTASQITLVKKYVTRGN
jgi:mono/diheme cytochrome c family protein